MKIPKEIIKEISNSQQNLNDYILFQEDGEIVFVPKNQRDSVEEVDGSEVILKGNTKIYNISSLLDKLGIEEPKTGDEFIAVLNAVAEKLDSLETSSNQ